ncbi:MAG: methylglyoxal synthase [Puniceicoccaceae bacterium MED-G30]|jgi:methylglyoxal synthase|nr:MAG: methylglyoxal synthase [Puniceicoccaceae bacterium MED-G30]|tara:strand:+ start:2296 stop:3198 length:903 start_codon:yes stop_codon:yes gene_type:complete
MNHHPDYENTVDVLTKASPLKQAFTHTEIETFAKMAECKEYDEGASIMTEGEPAASLMLVLKGEVRVLSKDHQLAKLGVGEIFGEGLFSNEGIRMANVQASEKTAVIIFTLEHYETLIKIDPITALKLKLFFESVYEQNKAQNDKFFHVDSKKYLALIAHNEMKSSLVGFVKEHYKLINQFPLVATGTTGLLLFKETGLTLSRKVKSGPLGGDQAVGNMISNNNICGVIFFRDPLSAHPHQADIAALGRLCDVYQIPFATNPSTAEAVLTHLSNSSSTDTRHGNPALEKYQERQSQVVKN